MWLLTVRDLVFRAKRFLVVIVGTSLIFTLLFLMTGLVEQFNQEPFLTVDAIGGSTWVLPGGVSGPFTSSATLRPDQVVSTRADGPTDPIVVARGTLNGPDGAQESVVVGHVPGGIGTPPTSDGRAAETSGELVVDRTSGLAVGDRVTIGKTEATVVGLSTDTTLLAGLPVVFAPIDDARSAIYGGNPVISAIVTDGSLVRSPPDATVLSAADVGADALGPLENAISSVDLIRGLLWFVAAVIIGGVLYLTALERQRDFAVLKAIGGTARQLSASLAIQAMLIALLAAGFAMALQALIVPVFPLTVRVPPRAFWQVPLLAVAVAFVAAQAGLRRVRRTDPATAFAGP